MPIDGPVVALDVGERRIGVAVSDPQGSFAFPHATIERTNVREDVAAILAIARERDARTIVVGDPLTLAGARGIAAGKIDAFVAHLARAFDGRIERIDERLTTAAVQKSLIGADVSRAKRKTVVDKLAAAMILETYLARARVNRVRLAFVNTAIAIVVAAGVIVAAASLWFRDAVYGDRTLPVAPASFVVPNGSTLGEVAASLSAAGILAHPFAFRILARLRGDEADVQTGEFRFPARQSTDEILRRLISGNAEARWVTFPEGFTAREMGRRLGVAKLAVPSAFDRYAAHTGLEVDGTRTPSLEGYLFPSTYLIPVGTSPERIAQILTGQFFRELPPNAAAKARALGLDVPQVITIASLIEREAQADDERPLMAGVYYNRLRAGMPLQVDATIEYVFPEHHTVITRRDLEIPSRYNTYLHAGLPPTPIANPGKASIDAAFDPAPSPYLYYVYKGNGHHAFARTLEEHEANIARYLH